jgi:D-threo-aldose 1-dehydrogenase
MRAADIRRLGASALSVSTLGFGTTAIGNLYRARTDAEADAALGAAWDAGVRYVDTAPLYGLTLSEQRLGAFLKGRPRGEVVISTKVGRLLEPPATDGFVAQVYKDAPKLTPRFDYTGDGIRRSFEESLARLGVEHIDLLYLHDLAPMNHASQEAYDHHFKSFFDAGGHEVMQTLKREGRVTAVGVGVGSAEAAARLLAAGDFDACLLAGRYTLLEQGALADFLPLCERRGVGVVIGGPYNSGILATGAVEGATYNYRPAPPDVAARVRRVEAVCTAHEVPLIAAALQFPLHHAAVASTIPGLATAQEVAQAVELINLPIPPEFYAALKAQDLIAADAPVG